MTVSYYNNYVDTTNFSDVTPMMSLVTGSALSFTVPGLATQNMQALFEYASNSNVFVGYNVTATVPASGTLVSGGNKEFKPKKRFVKGGDVLSFITPDASAYVGVSFRVIPS